MGFVFFCVCVVLHIPVGLNLRDMWEVLRKEREGENVILYYI